MPSSALHVSSLPSPKGFSAVPQGRAQLLMVGSDSRADSTSRHHLLTACKAQHDKGQGQDAW
jgi:hypothetical protein